MVKESIAGYDQKKTLNSGNISAVSC